MDGTKRRPGRGRGYSRKPDKLQDSDSSSNFESSWVRTLWHNTLKLFTCCWKSFNFIKYFSFPRDTTSRTSSKESGSIYYDAEESPSGPGAPAKESIQSPGETTSGMGPLTSASEKSATTESYFPISCEWQDEPGSYRGQPTASSVSSEKSWNKMGIRKPVAIPKNPVTNAITYESALLEKGQFLDLKSFDECGNVKPPECFQGKLFPGEKWCQCPYFKAHVYISSRDSTHLSTCRQRYTRLKALLGQEMDIEICRFRANHHVHKSLLEAHEEHCVAQYTLFTCVQLEIEKQRMSKLKKEKTNKQSKGESRDEE